MTSLSRQLSRLRVPQTNVQREGKGRVSFLYDFLEAKSIDNDMNYAIAVSGLQSLIQLDPRIERFADTLFNESSKTIDRAIQSAEANQDLDTEIEAFLFIVVTNYFLLNSTHKTIEWLIYRYGINDYNMKALIASALPYHETRLFTRLLQTCSQPKVDTNRWHWLKEVQKSGSPLPKTTLITHCISEKEFLRYICDFAVICLKIDSKSNSYLTFYVSTAINVIKRNTNESIVSLIIGYVIKGLKSKNQLLRNACLCITAFICSRIPLEDNVCHKLVKAMAKRANNSSISDQLLITLCLVNRFQRLNDLPQKLVNCLDENLLIECNDRNDIQDLICLVLKCCLNNCNELEISEKLIKILDKLNLNSQTIDVCIQTIAEYMTSGVKEIPVNTFTKVMSLLELRFPQPFDTSLSRLETIGPIAQFLGAFRYSFLKSSKIPLIYGLTNVNPSVQIEAINHLVKHFDVLVAQRDEQTINTIKTLLSDALSVKSPQILITVFGLKEKMFQILSEEEMKDICYKLLVYCHSMDEQIWHQLKNSILATYCSLSTNTDETNLSLIYPFLLPLNQSDFITLSIILDSNIAKSINLLNVLRKKFHKQLKTIDVNDVDSTVGAVCTQIAEYFAKNADLINENTFIQNTQTVDYLKSSALSIIVLERIHVLSNDGMIKQKSADILLTIIESLVKSTKLSKSKHNLRTFDDFLSDYLRNVRKQRISLTQIDFVFNSLINSIDTQNDSDVWLSFKQLKANHYFYKLFLIIFNNSFDNNKRKSMTFQSLSINFIGKVFKTIGYDFFVPLWTDNQNPLWQSRSLAVSSNLFKTVQPINDTIILSVLMAMHSPIGSCRESALNVAKDLSHFSNNQLLKLCLKSNETIKSDENFVSHVIADWFQLNPKNKSVKTEIDLMSKHWIHLCTEDNTPEQIKAGIVLLLNKCDNSLINPLFEKMKPYLHIICPNSYQMKTIESLMSIFIEPNILQKSDIETEMAFNFFITSIQTKFTQHLALNLINKQLLRAIPTKGTKICLLNKMLDLIVETNNQVANKRLNKILKSGELISSLMQTLVPNEESTGDCEPKRMFSSDSQFSHELIHWKKIIVLLEIIQTKQNLTEISILVKTLFNYLKQTFIMDSKTSFEYLRQLLLNSINNCLNQTTDDLPLLPIDSVIECLRETQQKETQNIALILICSLAEKFKKEVLDYVIIIFTFIGTNLLHCDDQYSIQLVLDTMEAIIPILVSESSDSKDVVINVFVDSMPDIPAHRRLPLFRKLLQILGEREHLAIIFMKFVEKIFNKSKTEKEPFLRLIVALSSMCDINTQINSINKILDVFAHEFTEGQKVLSVTDQNLSDNDRKLIAQSLAQLVLRIVSSQEFIENTINSEWILISEEMLAFLHRLVVLIVKYSGLESDSLVKDSNIHRRRIRSHLSSILLQFNTLLPNQQLIELVFHLLRNESIFIQRKALELLNDKLNEIKSQSLDFKQLIHLFKTLKEMVPTADSVNLLDEQHVYNCQLSMITIKLLSKHCGENEKIHEIIYKLIEKIISLIMGMKAQINNNFKASCVLCLTQLMICLANNAIPLIPSFVPILLSNFNVSEEVVIISNITSISKISQTFPQFLSPYLDQIIVKLLNICNTCPQFKPKLKTIWSCFAKLIPKRVLLNSIDNCFEDISNISVQSLTELMDLLKQTFEDIKTKSEVSNAVKFAKSLLMKALDLRNSCNNNDLSEINNFENSSNGAFCVFIPKMTEVTFRPLFYKLYDWVIRDKNGKHYHKMISFYKFLDLLADRLKSLFCIFIAPSIVNNCSQMLSLYHSDNESELTLDSKTAHLLIINILSTLSKCFLHDISGSFLNRERMQALVKPLINQLSNTLGTADDYMERVDTICLCTQYLIESNKDETIIKEINYQILLKTRETSIEVRLGALKALHRLVRVSGEDYLPVIPETIPFISELSEDESNDIEDVVKTIVIDLEHILGEPIDKYL